MKKNPTLRTIGFTVAKDVNDNDVVCGDRAALGLQRIELAIKAHELGSPSTPDLVELGKQYFRLEIIEEAAKEIEQSRKKAGKKADFGEILIAFQTHVKDEFDLPIDTEKMHYRTSEYVSEKEIEFARKSVAAKEDGQEMVEFLTRFRPLNEQFEKLFPGRFSDLQMSFEEREEALCVIPEGWSEGKYIEETRALMAEKATAEQALYRALTHEAVERERGRGPEIRAQNQYNRGNRLRGLGWNEAALKAIRDAVGRYRKLATTSPDTFRPDLAKSLRSLGDTLKAMNLNSEAIEVGREAVDVYRELAVARPDAFGPDLADSLGNLSKQLGARNRYEEALEVGQEAADLYRKLAAARPDAFQPHLTDILDNLSKQAVDRDQHELALKSEHAALRLGRRLAALHPTFPPRLANSLGSMNKMFIAWTTGSYQSRRRSP